MLLFGLTKLTCFYCFSFTGRDEVAGGARALRTCDARCRAKRRPVRSDRFPVWLWTPRYIQGSSPQAPKATLGSVSCACVLVSPLYVNRLWIWTQQLRSPKICLTNSKQGNNPYEHVERAMRVAEQNGDGYKKTKRYPKRGITLHPL